MALVFDKSVEGRRGVSIPPAGVPSAKPLPENVARRREAPLCELSELDVVRHFTELSRRNFGVETGFYPLGSCTMKYNPKILESIAALEGFLALHPMLSRLGEAGGALVQGALGVVHDLEQRLRALCGMDAFTLQPLAGAHGELTGLMIIAAYHRARGRRREFVLIPDEAHGTNPSSATIAGFTARSVPTSPDGMLDVDALKKLLDDRVAAVMLTNPNTLGIFNRRIGEVVEAAHRHDAQVYYDGANLNAVLGRFRPGDAGIDVMHVNLHKTFATPHGGGGPGAGPVGVRRHLEKFLPAPRVSVSEEGTFFSKEDFPESIGSVAPFFGNFLVCLRALAYIDLLGAEGLTRVSEHAVLNANYLQALLREVYDIPYDGLCKHEFVLSARRQAEGGVGANDIAKALIDAGFHPPTVHFPLIVREALMIEPSETESMETLDAFAAALLDIARLAETHPEQFAEMPRRTAISRPDEARAARHPDLASLGTAP